MVKSGLEFILKLTEPLQSCCCPVQKYLPRMAELAWQLSKYLWRGSVNFKISSRPLFTIIFKLKNDNFKTRDFSPLIKRILTGEYSHHNIFFSFLSHTFVKLRHALRHLLNPVLFDSSLIKFWEHFGCVVFNFMLSFVLVDFYNCCLP